MTINPIIPVWLMLILCACMLLLKRKGTFAYVRQIIAVVLIFLINLRIMVPSGEVEVTTQNLSTYVVFVVDDTISMLARDYDGSGSEENERLTAAKRDCQSIIDSLEGAKFSVITFNNDANLVCPFSDSYDYVSDVIDSIYPIDSLYARGSSMNVCVDVMTDTLKRAHEKADGSVAVFFVSDGEITNDDELESFAGMRKYVDCGAVLGYGTKKGGNMYVTTYYSSTPELLQDTSSYPYTPAVSKIDEDNLKSIADDLNVDYINMNDGSVDGVIDTVKKMSVADEQVSRQQGYVDIYYIFAGMLAALVVWEFCLLKKKLQDADRI